ncbi:MAG TPA: hypothetical protein VKQ06_01505 [Gammaproteobacteria bacterium]|nr:hypothetical protein [Gammaproteobacteria bacterium]
MRILLTKLSDQRHLLEVVRSDASREAIELVTREALFHDFLHHAVESSMPTQGGFWGALARGKTFADLNDRSGVSMKDAAATLYAVEAAVGMMTGAIDLPADQAWEKLRGYHETQALEMPQWCTESFVADVRERMRQMLGHWKATPYGESMKITWPEPDSHKESHQ